MAVFKVTTSEDVINASDGVISLREAIAAAASSSGADTISFDIEGQPTVELKSTLKIAAGNNVTIDGSPGNLHGNYWIDGDYAGNPFMPGFTMFEIASGATVRLVNLTLANGFERGADGTDGIDGTSGLSGNDGKGDTGTPGSNGNGGTGGSSATTAGKMAVGGIDNAGVLTLDRVDFTGMSAFGGEGGSGGRGGNGGNGGSGAPNYQGGVGGGGGAGGHANSGGNGTNGAAAVAAIYNHGTLTLIDTTIAGANAYGGNGGKGGQGGQGGAGGKGGASTGTDNHGGYGGYGGNGGHSGNSGNAGDAASAILNAGTILSQGKLAAFQGNEVAGVSIKVTGGGGGGAGFGGSGDPRGSNGVGGTRGKDGAAGTDGDEAGTNHILGSAGQASFVKNTFVIVSPVTTVDEGGLVQFGVRRLGDSAEAVTVEWAISGLTAADFNSGQALSGTISFAAKDAGLKLINVSALADGLAEGDETFTLTLKNASAGNAVGVNSSVKVTIDDENQAPTSLSLSKTTVAQEAAIGTVVGTFSGVDPDGDALTFSLLTNFGGFFSISGGNKLTVAKALDPDRHSYNLFVEADDGNGGSFAKSITVRLQGYVDGTDKGETLEGSSGVDHIFGYGGVDTLRGFAGADFLYGGSDKDRMEGGADNDTYFVDNAGDTIVETAAGGTADVVKTSVSYDLLGGVHVERLMTSNAAATTAINLYGNSLAQEITGNAGKNLISDGGPGKADVLIGLAGNDTYRVYNSGDVIKETATQGTSDTVLTAVDYTLGAGVHVETLATLDPAGTTPLALFGNEFKQAIIGNAGANSLRGYAGDDIIKGGDGNDRISGGDGKDTLTGGVGKDWYYFSGPLNAATNVDTITGFSSADAIYLAASVFTKAGAAGTLAAGAFWSSATGAAHDASDRIIYETDTGNIRYDPDGTGAATPTLFAIVGAGLAMNNADFVIY